MLLCELSQLKVHITIRNSALHSLLKTSGSQRTRSRITLHNLTNNLHLNTEKPKLQKTHQKDKPTTALDVKSKTMHLNQIQFISTELFILQNWLWASNAAKLSSTEFCCKTTEVHSPTLWTESKGGLFSHTEQCTSLYTDNFGILKEAFRAFSKLDPQ